MTTFLLAWYFACIGPAGYDEHSDKVCSYEFKNFEKALNYSVTKGSYKVPFKDRGDY